MFEWYPLEQFGLFAQLGFVGLIEKYLLAKV